MTSGDTVRFTLNEDQSLSPSQASGGLARSPAPRCRAAAPRTCGSLSHYCRRLSAWLRSLIIVRNCLLSAASMRTNAAALQCQPFQRAQTRVLILISIAISYTFCSRVPRQCGQIDDLVAIFGGLDLQLGGFGFQPGYPVFSSTFSARSVSTLPLTASVTLPTARSPSSSCASSAPTR